jgi:putative heme-binding domain-containing protein
MRTRLATRAVFTLLVAALVPLTDAGAASPPAPDGLPTFRVPAGFVVEKVAGPPLVRYPLFAAFDDRGRLFVAEGTGTNLPGEELARRKLGRIVLLEASHGDGKFDTSRVFADRLVFPQGVLWHDGALYAASHPSLWRLEDPEGKGTATRRVEVVSGFRFNGNGCDIHGPFRGPDGRLYWTDGRHGYKVHTPEGGVLEGLAARIWRCRPEGTEIERLCGGGFDNPVAIAFTPEGEAIGTMDQGPGDCLLHYVEGGVYPMEHPCLNEFVRTGPLLGAVRQYSAVLPAALCGMTRYRSASFGEEYRDCLFSTHYMLHKFVRHTLVPDGSTFRALDQDFLTTTSHDVRLTDVVEDADGSLLFIDMGAWFTYGFLGSPSPKPEALGAIYRIRRAGAAPVADPWGKALHLEGRSPAELAPLLHDPRPKVRDLAIDRLVKHGAAAVPTLEGVLRTPGRATVQARRNAVWALCRIRLPAARSTLRRALADPDPSVRLAAAHTVGVERDGGATTALCRLVQSGTPSLRRKAAEALGRIGRAEAVPALLEGLRQGGDRFLEHALVYALIRINDRQTTLPALTDTDARVRRAGLVALDQMKDGRLTRELVAPFLETGDPNLQGAALEVISRRPAWSGLTEAVVRKWLGSGSLSVAQKRSLTDVLLAGSAEAAVQRVVAEALAGPQTPVVSRLLLLDVLGQCRLDPLPDAWLDALARALMESDRVVCRAAVATAKLRKANRFDQQLLAISRKAALPADLRIAALECLGSRGRLDEEAFALLTSHLSDTTEPLLRLAAARALGTAALTNAQLSRLAGSTEKASTMVLRLLLPVFTRTQDPAVGTALVEALQRSPAAEALGVAELDGVLRGYPEQVRDRARTLREKLTARHKGQAAYLARLTADLDRLRGDPDAGQEVFLSSQVGCYGCHRAVGRGGDVGPDLSRIGRFRTRAELLESIVFPSLTIAPEYRPYQVAVKDGRMVTGLIVRDTTEALHLRTTDLAEVRVARKDVETITPSAVSLMPEGLEKTMTRQQLCDLLEFLRRQR